MDLASVIEIDLQGLRRSAGFQHMEAGFQYCANKPANNYVVFDQEDSFRGSKQRGHWPARRHICYQSKVGASKWLRPSMHETVKALAAADSRHIVVAPISFVSDHVETLHEIDIEHRAQAKNLGIEISASSPA